MDGGDRGGRKERAISRVECNDVSTLLPPLTTFRLILSVRRKRSSRSVSPARHQPACSYSRELIVAHPRRHPPFYPSPLPPLLASSRPRSFFLSRDCSGNGRDHLKAIIEIYYIIAYATISETRIKIRIDF